MSRQTFDIAFEGLKVDAKGKRFWAIRPLDESGAVPVAPVYFPVVKGVTMAVGHIYTLEGEADESGSPRRLNFGTRKWKCEYANGVEVAAWQAAHVAAERTAKAKAWEKREATNASKLEDLLLPLQRAYQRLPFGERAGFETWVLNRLRSTK
jgi:hypothetical protein